jgi:hypothetical protein
MLQKPVEPGGLKEMPACTPPTSFLPFIFPRCGHTFSPTTFNEQNHFDSIHEALDGTSPRHQLWYDDSSLYTSQVNRRQAAEDDHASHAQAYRSSTTHTTADVPRDILSHLDAATQAEWVRAPDVAFSQPEECEYSVKSMSSQQATPGDSSTPASTIADGDDALHSVGRAGGDIHQASPAVGGLVSPSRLDGMTQEVGEMAGVASESGEPVTFPSLSSDDANSPCTHSELQYPYEDTWD